MQEALTLTHSPLLRARHNVEEAAKNAAIALIDRYQRNIKVDGGKPVTSEIVRKTIIDKGLASGVKEFVLFEGGRYDNPVKGVLLGITEGVLMTMTPKASTVVFNMQGDAKDYEVGARGNPEAQIPPHPHSPNRAGWPHPRPNE